MSFLRGLGGAAGAGEALGALQPNSAATGVGHLFGVDPSRIEQIANSIGKASNGIAAAGGAPEGYAAPEPAPIANHMQLLDPAVLQSLMRQFQMGQR